MILPGEVPTWGSLHICSEVTLAQFKTGDILEGHTKAGYPLQMRRVYTHGKLRAPAAR
jgi:hypothetical protein